MTTEDLAPLPLQDEAQQLGRTLHDLQGILRTQREVLRQRGMSLPAGVMTLLEDAQIGLQGLISSLKEETEDLHQLRALTDTTAMINSSLELDEVLNKAMDTVIHLTGAERGYLMLRDENSGEMEYRVARNMDRDITEQSGFTVSRSVINQVAESGEPVVTTNALDDPRFATQESIVSFALRSILCVPLKSKEQVVGVIYADNRIRAGLFGDSELEMLFGFANQAAVAIENARLFERVRTALAEITEIKELMDDVFTSIPSGVIVTDENNKIQTHNQAASEILALKPDQSLGEAIDTLLPYMAEGLLKTLEAIRTENRRATVELTAQVGNRGQRNLNFKLSPLRNTEQSIEGVAIVLDDMTDLRQREAQLNVVRRYLPPAMVDNIQSIAQLDLGGVRRDITVVYIDVRPMATLPAGLSPQQQMKVLNRYMSVSSGPLHRYGGVIDKYMGTEVMALFNTQLNPSKTHEWDALQAVLDMVDDFQQLYTAEEAQNAPYYRIGIHSGIATMGNVGSVNRREFTAIGDTVNLAHRLVDLAQQGEIIISEDIYAVCKTDLDRAQGGIAIIDRGKIQIRGRKQPVQIYQLQRGM